MVRTQGLMAGVLAFGLLTACSPSESASVRAETPAAAEETARHPVSGLKVIDLVVERGTKKLPFKVELADTPEAQARGLMFREKLGDNEGMIFPSDVPETRSFWMKNTPLPLDIIFIGTDNRITNIENAVPYSLDSVPSKGLTIAVFEIRGGLSEKLGIKAGDKVTWDASN